MIKEKSLQPHLAQRSFERFVFKILYNTAIPSSAAIERFFSTEKRYFEAEEQWAFRVRRLFPNGFVFEMQFRVKVFQ